MKLAFPELSLVVLIGPSGSGKSTFAAKHFAPTEVLSSDFYRGLISDDESDMAVTDDAFEVLHLIAAKRLAAGRLTVVDATNVRPQDRAPLVTLARRYHCLPVAVVFNVSESICHQRNARRTDRAFGGYVVRQQANNMRKSLRRLEREGFRHVFILDGVEQIDAATIDRQPMASDRRRDSGPFDIIGDLHGCCDELEELLDRLGYEVIEGDGRPFYRHPDGRRVVFVGDLVDRGPRILDTAFIVRDMVDAGSALCVPGDHDMRLVRKLRGRDVPITHGLDRTLSELHALESHRRARTEGEIVRFLDSLTSHYVFDAGKLVVAHAGMREEMQGRGSGRVRDFALYGQTTGETDGSGLPIRHDWALEYRGAARVVYGDTPVPDTEWVNRTVNIDTGCVFGGKLTALRYPELQFVSVPARRAYCTPARPPIVEEAPPRAGA